MRILIAEDEPITRLSLQRQLQAWGHQVTPARDGQQAWEQFEAGAAFDIVITDWEMPRLSGVELVRRIRESRRELSAYVIILTSRIDQSDIVKGIEAGADDFDSKPFDRQELRVRLLAGERIVRLERTLTRQNEALRRDPTRRGPWHPTAPRPRRDGAQPPVARPHRVARRPLRTRGKRR